MRLTLGVMLTSLLAAAAHTATITVEGTDSAALRAAVERSQTGDVVQLPAGTYSVTEALAPKSGTHLRGSGQAETVLRFAGEKPAVFLSLVRVQGVTISDLTLDGASSPQAVGGIAAYDARGLTIRRVTIRNLVNKDSGPHGIHFNGDNPTRQHGVTDSLIEDCTLENLGVDSAWGAGIRMSWGSSRNRVLGCKVDRTGRGGIFGNDGSTDLIIRGNTVTGSHGEMLGIEVWGGCDRSVIEDNHIDHWLSIGGCDWCAVRRNTISATDGSFGFIGIEAIGSHLIFTDNVVDDGQLIGLSLSGPGPKQYHYYANNTFHRCSQWGAQLQGEAGGDAYQYYYRCRFSQTTVARGKVGYPGDEGHGFRTNGNTQHLVLEECEMRDNGRFGVQLGGAQVDYLSFLRCAIAGNKGAAVVGPGGYHPGPPGPYTALEWVDCKVEGNATNDLPPAKPFSQPAPTAGFTAPQRVRVGETVRFASTSRTAAGEIAHALWDFGDGPPVIGNAVEHVYPRPGDYTVTLVVWDAAGRGARAARELKVTP